MSVGIAPVSGTSLPDAVPTLEIPAVVGAGDALSIIRTGDMVIVDGLRGEIVVNPSDITTAEARGRGRDSKDRLPRAVHRTSLWNHSRGRLLKLSVAPKAVPDIRLRP